MTQKQIVTTFLVATAATVAAHIIIAKIPASVRAKVGF